MDTPLMYIHVVPQDALLVYIHVVPLDAHVFKSH